MTNIKIELWTSYYGKRKKDIQKKGFQKRVILKVKDHQELLHGNGEVANI